VAGTSGAGGAQTASTWLAEYWGNRAGWGQIIANLFSLRLFYVCAASSLTVGIVLAALIWEPLAYLAVPLFFALWLGLSISPTTVAYCPYCSKRVKLGASACHHCGRAV
jgi:FtsH-binding integral membrane protein